MIILLIYIIGVVISFKLSIQLIKKDGVFTGRGEILFLAIILSLLSWILIISYFAYYFLNKIVDI